jgi:hypothetical protein
MLHVWPPARRQLEIPSLEAENLRWLSLMSSDRANAKRPKAWLLLAVVIEASPTPNFQDRKLLDSQEKTARSQKLSKLKKLNRSKLLNFSGES